MEKATTLKEIAYKLHLSVNTISRALRDCDDIAAETKREVIKTAIEMGYMRSSLNQMTTKGDKKLFAVILGNVANLYFNLYINEFDFAINASGNNMAVVYVKTEVCDADVIKQCVSERVDGIISLKDISEDGKSLAKLQNIPIVFVGKKSEIGIYDSINNSGLNAFAVGVEYLANYHPKNKTIIYFNLDGNVESKSAYDSLAKILKKSHPDISLEIYNSDQKEEVYKRIVEEKYISLVSFSDELSYDLLAFLNDKVENFRYVFPHFHLLSCDGLCQHIKGLVDITTIDHDYTEVAIEAVDMLNNRLSNPDSPIVTKRIPSYLHIRKNK